MRLSILIAHNPIQKWRIPLFERLFHNLELQIKFDYQDHWVNGGRAYIEGNDINVIWDNRERISIGEKRNALIAEAVKYQDQNKDGYVAFVDDDDNVSKHYVSLLLEGIRTGADCCSLRGIITDDGVNPRVFEHSIKYKEYRTVIRNGKEFYERYPNHLNCMKLSIAQQFPFPAINHSEDTDFANQVFRSGLLKTEHWIDEIIYHYEFQSKK